MWGVVQGTRSPPDPGSGLRLDLRLDPEILDLGSIRDLGVGSDLRWTQMGHPKMTPKWTPKMGSKTGYLHDSDILAVCPGGYGTYGIWGSPGGPRGLSRTPLQGVPWGTTPLIYILARAY